MSAISYVAQSQKCVVNVILYHFNRVKVELLSDTLIKELNTYHELIIIANPAM